jgi:hypothetical protein
MSAKPQQNSKDKHHKLEGKRRSKKKNPKEI